jgi:hypothetical protein
VTVTNNRKAPNQICETFAVRNASAVEPEVVMLASARVPESGAALACARERFISTYFEVDSYAGSLLPLQLRQASLLDAVAQELRLVAAE